MNGFLHDVGWFLDHYVWQSLIVDYLAPRPWLILALVAAPLVALAYFSRTHPSKRLTMMLIT